MAKQMVRVVALFSVQPDRVQDFIREGRKKLVDPTRGEPGCILYDLCQDLADPTRFAMIEAWESQEDLEVHLRQPSLQAALASLAPMAAGTPSVQRFRSVSREA